MAEIAELLSAIKQRYAQFDDPIEQSSNINDKDDLEVSKDYLTERYLTPSTKFSKEWLNRLQEPPAIDKLEFSKDLFTMPESESRLGTRFKRSGLDGKIVGYEEFTLPGRGDANAKNSLSMNRQVGSKLDFVRGRAGFMPFQPGGLDPKEAEDKVLNLHRDNQGIYDTPPGFTRGLKSDFSITNEESEKLNEEDDDEQEDEEEIDEEEAEDEKTTTISSSVGQTLDTDADLAAIDELLPAEISFGRAKSQMFEKARKTKDWAHIVDINKRIDNFKELVPTPAREFPFELDVFQKEAVYHLEQGDSVFVAAHTSAGKTVVAEYAISMAQRNMTKVIYTSPIKALSNQKYRDFRDEYDDVGILTGDVQINPEASCLIMTTEILRSMLYRGADLIRDVEFVIFDEVHYVNDQDRGVVWEEVIIMLPNHIKFILLSATVPNTFEFANWVGRTKQKDIYVISTAKRPVPLVHHMWSKNKLVEIVDSNKKFLESGYKKVESILNPKQDGNNASPANRGGRGGSQAPTGRGGGAGRGGPNNRGGAAQRGAPRGGARGGGGQLFIPSTGRQTNQNMPGKTTFMQLCQYLHKNKLLPVVMFVFSKKRCEEYAMMLTGIDYCTNKEKSEIRSFIDKAVARLKQEDRDLPQINRVRELLSRGIGVHHGGLLPIVKEVIEILFAKSLVKVLFATETFAMGLNLPTRTVVFANTRKHDGKSFRDLMPGEYTQMAGRAGRRGLDDTGTVIILANGPDPPPQGKLKEMMLGTPTKLQSQFRLTYNMILNLLRIEALKVEEMIKRSFSENASQVMLPEHEKSVKTNQDALEKMARDECEICDKDIDKVHEAAVRYQVLTTELIRNMAKIPIGRNILSAGRLIVYQLPGHAREFGIVSRLIPGKEQIQVLAASKYEPNHNKDALPFFTNINGYAKQHLVPFKLAKGFTPKTIEFGDVQMIVSLSTKQRVADLVRGDRTAIKACQDELSFSMKYQDKWHEANLSRVRNAQAQVFLKERDECLETIKNSQCIQCPTFNKTFKQVHEVFLVKQKIDDLKNLISDQNLDLLPDYEQRINVLKELQYIDDESNVLLKGRVACEVSTGFELIITELVLDNFLGEYEPEEIVALLSCFVFEGNTQVEADSVTPHLDQGKARILEIVNKVNRVFEHHQVLITQEEADFAENKRFGLMEAVYEWARGMTFSNITELTDVAEGTIVRVITRLDEVCRQVMAAARIIGDSKLYEKMTEAQEKIKRDIVFCASLYL